jgi:hypothetical protein
MKLSKSLDTIFENKPIFNSPRKLRKGEQILVSGTLCKAELNIEAGQSCVIAGTSLVPLDGKKLAENKVTTKYRKRRNTKKKDGEKLDLYAGYLFGRVRVFSKVFNEADPAEQLELTHIWAAYPHTTGYTALLEVSLYDATRKDSVPAKKDKISPVNGIINYIPLYIPEEGQGNPRRDDEGNPTSAGIVRQFSMYYVAPGGGFFETFTNGRTESEIQTAVNALRSNFSAPVGIPWPHSSGPCLDFAGTLFVDLNAAITFYSTISIPAPIPSFNLTAYTWLFGGQTLGQFQAMCIDGWQNYTDQYEFEYYDLDQSYIVYATSKRYTADTMPSHIIKYGQAYVLPPFSSFTQLETECPLGSPEGWPPETPPLIPDSPAQLNFYRTFCSYSKELKGVLYSLFYYPEDDSLTEIILGFVPFTPNHPFEKDHPLISWVNLYQLDLSTVDIEVAEQEYLAAREVGLAYVEANPEADSDIIRNSPEYKTWAEKSFIYKFVKYDPNLKLYNPALLLSGEYPTEAEKTQFNWRTSFTYLNKTHTTYYATTIPDYKDFPESSPRYTFLDYDAGNLNNLAVSNGGYLYNSDKLNFFQKSLSTSFTEEDFVVGASPNAALLLTFNKDFILADFAGNPKSWKSSTPNPLMSTDKFYSFDDLRSTPSQGLLSYTISKLK